VAAKRDNDLEKQRTYDDSLAFWEELVMDVVRAIRNDKDWKRKHLSNRLGIEDYELRNMERGHRQVRMGEFFLLAQALQVDPEWLIHEVMSRKGDEIRLWMQMKIAENKQPDDQKATRNTELEKLDWPAPTPKESPQD
jgi:transcriptional regulator with XRE-family HTH domain